MLTSEALPVIGVPSLPIGAMRSGGVSGSSTVTLRRYYAANPEDRSLSCRALYLLRVYVRFLRVKTEQKTAVKNIGDCAQLTKMVYIMNLDKDKE